MPLKQAWRAFTTGAGLAVFLWRRYGSTPATKAATPSAEATPPTRQPRVVAADDGAEEGPSTESTQTVRFGLDGLEYEIALSDERAAELREALRRYTDAGRRVGRETKRPTDAAISRPRNSANHHDTAAIREWARAHGHPVSDRGLIPATVRQAYDTRRRRGSRGST